jgi:hypothetical protein
MTMKFIGSKSSEDRTHKLTSRQDQNHKRLNPTEFDEHKKAPAISFVAPL